LATKPQPDEIIDFFKIFYILLNEDYKHIDQNAIISNLKHNILPKYNYDSFSILLTKYRKYTIKLPCD